MIPQILFPIIGIAFVGNVLIALNYFLPLKSNYALVFILLLLIPNFLSINFDFLSNLKFYNVILYIEYPSLLTRYEDLKKNEKKNIEELEKNTNIKCIKIWELEKFAKRIYYENIRKDLLQAKVNSHLDKILLKQSLGLLSKIEFWHCFFEKFNVKI